MAWDSAGNIYVADGMGANNRVAKLDKDGRFIKHWGSTGSEPGQFKGLKAIAIDAKGMVYVADAGNKRIQVFDADGTFKSEFGNIGTPLAMCMTRGATQYLYVSHAGDTDGMEDAAIFKVRLDGTVVGKFGSAGKMPKEFGLANSIDCRNENELLIGEMTNWRVQKVSLKGTNRQKAKGRRQKAEGKTRTLANCRLPTAGCRLPSAVCRLPVLTSLPPESTG